nr:hypothetical protein [Clostridia bacterium]
MKKFAALLLAVLMVVAMLPAIAVAEEPTIVRWGTHWAAGQDPNMIDETTGNYAMGDEADRLLRLAAEAAVLEKHNVKIVHVQYAQDTRSELVLSVLAGNPCCEIARMWSGSENTVLAQNILQPLDDYAYIFEGADWMWPTAVFGHNYFVNANVSFTQYFPLLVNLTMIEQVEALKDENGNTIYPMDLLAQGKWTWSTFKDYLAKIDAHYGNTPAPADAKVSTIAAYETDYRFAGMAAMYSNGSGIYGDAGVLADSQESIDAIAYIAELLELGYMKVCGVYDDQWTPQWCEAGYDFGRGAAVFADCPNWVIKGQADACAARGESIAIMPWPAADRLANGDGTYSDDYQQVVSVGDIDGVLKGISPKMTKLALESYRTYWETYYALKAGVESMDQYKAAVAADMARDYGLDIYNEVYGQAILDAFIFNANKCIPNDVAGNLGMRDPWDAIMGKGLAGVDGMPAYDVAIKANLNQFSEVVAQMEAILGSTELNDNQAPSVSVSGKAIIALGTDLTTIDWTQYFSAEDGFDGVMDPALATYEVENRVDATVVGTYQAKAIFTDKAGNKGDAKVDVIVYNADNTTAPTLTVKAELPTIAQDTDMTTIDWAGAYVETAVDADGLDLKANVVADLSELDTSFPDVYFVILTVTDYAGNTAEVEIEVEVVAAE